MTDTTPSRTWTRLGLIAGGGELPVEIAQAVADTNPFVVRLAEFTEYAYSEYETTECSVGQVGGIIKALKGAGCDAICLAGYVKRPDLKKIRMDARGMIMVPKALAAGRKGDDAIIRVVVGEFEGAGFQVIGADEVLAGMAPQTGVLGAIQPDDTHQVDIDRATEVARGIGVLDIGQGAVTAEGVVLAVEAQEGTNAMLERVAALPETVRGTPQARCGVLAKMPKPIQERRVDLPTVGVETVERCAAAGLAGIVLEAGGALLVNRSAVIAACDESGLFLLALEGAGAE